MTNLEKAVEFFHIINSPQEAVVTEGVLYLDSAALSSDIVDAFASGYDQLMAG